MAGRLARSFAFSAAAAAIALSAPLVASATVIVPRTVEEMAQDSACVVRGRVLSSQAAWDDKHERIYTTTELEVIDRIHGPAETAKHITVRTLGGEVGTIGMKVAGTEKFTMNEEVVVFLRHDPVVTTHFQVVGMSQGKFHIQYEAKGRAMAVPNTEGLAFVKRDDTGVYKVNADVPQPDRLSLVELRQRIVDAIEHRPQANTVPQGSLQLKDGSPQVNQSLPDPKTSAPNTTTQP